MIRLLADANPSIYGSGLRSRSDWKTVAVGSNGRGRILASLAVYPAIPPVRIRTL